VRVVSSEPAGVVFTGSLTGHPHLPELRDARRSCSWDIDADRLSRAEKLVSRMAETAGSSVRVIAHDRSPPALKDADYVVVTDPGGRQRPVGGRHSYPGAPRGGPVRWRHHRSRRIFRGLRHLAVFDGLIEDIAELCPRALILQYSNRWPLDLGARRFRDCG